MVRESMESGQRFNLIFMDVQMPNVDGLRSTKLIREIGFSAPIVALTAFAEESNIKDCYDSGMNFFLPKPIRRPELKKVLNKYCPTIHEEEAEIAGSSAPQTNGIQSSKSGAHQGASTGRGRDSPKASPVIKDVPGSKID
jgi:osomolarity two-component system, sensor histidine kinase SLN1